MPFHIWVCWVFVLCMQNITSPLHQIFVSRHSAGKSCLAPAWPFRRDAKDLPMFIVPNSFKHSAQKSWMWGTGLQGFRISPTRATLNCACSQAACTGTTCYYLSSPSPGLLASPNHQYLSFRTAGLPAEGVMNALVFVGCQTQQGSHLIEALGCKTSETWRSISPSQGRSKGDTFLPSASSTPTTDTEWWAKPLLSGSSLTLLFTVIKMEMASDRHEHHFTSSSLNYLLLSTALPLSVWWEKYVFRTVILKSKYLNHQ